MIDSVLLVLPFAIVLLCVALFSGIEVAFASANRFSFELKKKQGLKSGRILSDLLEEPSRFISSVTIGLSIWIVGYGLLVGSILAPLWDWVEQNIGSSYSYIKYVRLIFETLISGSILLFIMFSFRAFFRAKADSVLSILAQMGILGLIHSLFYPIASMFITMADWILKYLFDVKIADQKPAIAAVDIEHFMQQTRDQSDDDQDINTQLFENALQLPSVKIRQCLVPRKEIEAIDINASLEEVKRIFSETKLSRLIIYENNIDNILGYIHQIALFNNPPDILSILMPIPAVPESMSATDLITKLTKERKSIAWVVDEFGGTAGIITLEDLLEEIFGEIRDEYDTDRFVEKQISENEYIFSGRLKIDYLQEKYNLDFDETDSETLSGYIINHHEMIPTAKERIIVGNFEFDIVNVSDTRIEMVKVKRLK
ncbi:MAG: HlyC/CorC family transporter [Chitinophagaceae bacterium]|nr:HlyC/CorC family transporter [Chitinophagaceae bacterium]MCW5925334.1 HlyC/CorC family transporter [Chitinophagaceae bacterium]